MLIRNQQVTGSNPVCGSGHPKGSRAPTTPIPRSQATTELPSGRTGRGGFLGWLRTGLKQAICPHFWQHAFFLPGGTGASQQVCVRCALARVAYPGGRADG